MVVERPKVLVVDDSPETLEMLTDVLSDCYAVVPALSGESALLKAARAPHPDIILLDILMPGLDGFEVCRRLKAHSATRDIPVIFLTAMLDQESELSGLNVGAVDYLRKPISIPMVRARLATHLELARSRLELAQRNEMLEEVVRLRDDIERITQHDLKGPLAAVIGFADVVLEEADLSDHHVDCLRRAIRAANRMLEMINRSLDLYKMETGRYLYEPQTFDLCKVIQRLCHDLEATARAHAVQVVVRAADGWMEEGVCRLLADQTLCYFMLTNLVKNAIEAAPADTQVTVTVGERDGDFVCIGIHNHGMVPESVQERFFEKYKTFGKEQGTGLGTYSAQLMARAQGGRVSMTTSLAEGTTVLVHLPMPGS
ncbi:MAG: hybrid sensor histidine kinase/response regulator [Magnetococcus sp. DMHC-8]